jgi:rubrerythrin
MGKKVATEESDGRITTLDELLTCPRCGYSFKKIDEHTYEPSCNCIKKKVRISVG